MREIRRGLQNNLDVSIYAKKEFNSAQMNEIREGLRDNLDVSIYAKSELTWEEMEKTRIKLLKEKSTQ